MTERFHFEGWEIVEKLGEGGMCAVYRVRSAADPDVERAIKVMIDVHPGANERFAAEARLLISLDHPNVLKVYELVEENPPWIVMELLAGRDLEEHRDTVDHYRPEQLALWFADLAQGLQKVHDLGVVHRDLKPSNIMLGTDGVPRLIDFGVARDTTAARVTKAGIVVGTASYLPPELFLESNPQHLQDQPVADVYSLGQTLCELLINRPIHDPDEFHGPKLLVSIMQDKISRPHLDPREWDTNIPKGLADIVIDATQQLPEDRIDSARELERRLRAWLEQRARVERAPLSRSDVKTLPPPPTGGTSGPSEPRQVRPRRSGGWLGGLLGMGAVGIVGLAVVGMLALGGLGIGLLVMFAPDAGQRTVAAAVEASIAGDSEAVQACVAGAGAKGFELDVVVARGSVKTVRIGGVSDPAAKACLEARVRSWSLPVVGGDVRVSIPVQLGG
ncbi:MAG: protein kinase [Myxococcota bacterium]